MRQTAAPGASTPTVDALPAVGPPPATTDPPPPGRLRFLDHHGFARDVAAMTVGGGLGTLFCWVLTAGQPDLAGTRLGTLAATIPAALFPGLFARRPLQTLAGLGAGLAGGLLFHQVPSSAPMLAALLLGVVLTLPLVRRPDGQWRWLTLLGGAAMATVATLLTRSPGSPLPWDWLPAWAASFLGGSAFAFLVGYGSILGHLELAPAAPPPPPPTPLLPAEIVGSLRTFGEEALQLEAKLGTTLDQHLSQHPADGELCARTRKAGRDLAARVVDQVRRWHQVERSLDPAGAERLAARIEELQARIDRTTDGTARQGFTAARDALKAQQELYSRLEVDRERLHARLHQHLATLERLQLTLVNLSSADAQRFSGEVQPLLDEVADLSREVDFISEVNEAIGVLTATTASR